MRTNLLLRFAACAAALAALACSSDDTSIPEPAAPDNPDQTAPYTITAAFEDETPESRVTMTDDGATKIELKWKADDKIYVVNSDAAGLTADGTLYTFTVVAESISQDGKSASFTCETFPTGVTPAYAIHQGTQSFRLFDPTRVNFDYYSFDSDINNFQNNFPLYAAYDTETAQFTFRPVYALLKLIITPPADTRGDTKIRIGSSDVSFIFYDGSYDITSGTAVRSRTYFLNDLQYDGYLSFTEGTESVVYLPFCPGVELVGKQLEIDVCATNAAYSASIRGASLEAGKCYPLTLGAAKWSGGRIYEGGTGSESAPYQLENETNLRALAFSVRTDNSYSGKYFRLTKSVSGIVTSQAEPWLPIGIISPSFLMPFSGYFDGGGNTVSGTFYLSDNHGTDLGFFGYATGSIRNLTIDGDMSYQGEKDASINIGGISGSCSAVTGCTHMGALTVENTTMTNTICAGGIAGNIPIEISACTQSSGTITVNAPSASVQAGGVAGEIGDIAATMHTCRNESDLMVTGKSNDTYAGALVGYNNGTTYDCSTFRTDLTVTVNGTLQNPVKAIGGGSLQNEPQPCDNTAHTAQP